MPEVTLMDVRKFFEYESATDFRRDWMALRATDRDQIKAGIANGTLTY